MAARDYMRAPDSSPASILALARAAGLLPSRVRRKGGWFVGACPAGCDLGRRASEQACHYSPDGEGWRCHRCGEKGGIVRWRELRGDAPGAELDALAWTPPPTSKASELRDLPGAWRELDAARSIYRERLAEWFRAVRGFTAEQAAALAILPDLAFAAAELAPLLPPGEARRILRAAEKTDRRVLALMRDPSGRPVSFARRWHLRGLAPLTRDGTRPKVMRAGNGLTGEHRTALYGSIPELVAAALRGELVVITEGLPDWCAATAVLRLAGRGAAVGAYSAGQCQALAAAVAAALDAAGAAPWRVRVVLVPHLGDTGAAGEKAMEAAASELAGRAAVHVLRVPTGPDGKGDLADAVAELARGEDCQAAALAMLAGAELRYAAPIDLRHATGSAELVERTRAILLEALAALMIALEVPAGGGKTFAATGIAAELAAAGEALLYALPTLAQAEEKADALRARMASGEVPTVPVRVLRGVLASCGVYKDAAEPVRRAMAAVFSTDGRRSLCEGCALRDACPAHAEDRAALPGAVTFVAHAGIRRTLAATPANQPVRLFVDEGLSACTSAALASEAFATLTGGEAWKVAGWRKRNPEAAEAIRRIVEALDAAAEQAAASAPKGAPPWREIGALVAELRQDAALRAELRGALTPCLAGEGSAAYAETASGPPLPGTPWGRPAEHSGWSGFADPLAWRFTAWTALAVTAEDGSPELAAALEWCGRHRLAVDSDGGWSVVSFEAVDLGLRPADLVAVLDATATDRRADLEALATLNGRRAELRRVDVVGHLPARAVHLDTEGLAARRILFWTRLEDGRRVRVVRPEAVATVRRCLLVALAAAPNARDVGVLCASKVLADALEGRGQGQAAAELAAFAAELADLRGYKLRVGYVGADHVATDRFRGVGLFVLLGTPRPNIAAMAEQAAALATAGVQVNAQALTDGLTRSNVRQAIGRPRTLRDPGVTVVLAGAVRVELPGWTWETAAMPEGGRAPTLASVDAHTAARRDATLQARELDAVSPAVLRRAGHARCVAEKAAAEVAKARGWSRYRVPFGHGAAWFHAATWADAADAATIAAGTLAEEKRNDSGRLQQPGRVDIATPRARAAGPAHLPVGVTASSGDHKGKSRSRPPVNVPAHLLPSPRAPGVHTLAALPGWRPPNRPGMAARWPGEARAAAPP